MKMIFEILEPPLNCKCSTSVFMNPGVIGVFLAVLLIVLPKTAVSQATTQPGTQTAPDTGLLDKQIGSGGGLGSANMRSNDSLVFSVTGTVEGNDNVYYSGQGNSLYDNSGIITPRIALQHAFRRGDVAFDYALSGQKYFRYSTLDRISHDGGLDFRYLLTPRWIFTLGERFRKASDPGSFYSPDSVLDQSQSSLDPNSSILTRRNDNISNLTFLSLSYRLSRRASLTWGANASFTRYTNQPPPDTPISYPMQDMNRYGGTLTYSYQLKKQTTMSLGYQFSYMDFVGNQVSLPTLLGQHVARTHIVYTGFAHQFSKTVSGIVNAGATQSSGLYTPTQGLPGDPEANKSRPYFNLDALTPGRKRTLVCWLEGRPNRYGWWWNQWLIQTTICRCYPLGYQLFRRMTASVDGFYSNNLFLQTITLDRQNSKY